MTEVKTYPRFKHHETKGSIIAKSADHEKSLGDGWHESRADFKKKKPVVIDPHEVDNDEDHEVEVAEKPRRGRKPKKPIEDDGENED